MQEEKLYVLGVESSCDETAAAVLFFEESAEAPPPRVLSNVVASQEDIHSRFGGVVPELASRRHVELIAPVIEAALEDASIGLEDLGGVAVTRGPGLVVSLLVGLSAAKAISWARDLPMVGVHHLNGHIHSLFLDNPFPHEKGEEQATGAWGGPPPFPHLAFVASGGHTDLYRVEDHDQVTHLGGTLDDAVGEAYDKIAASMGLGYPGGATIDRLHGEFFEKQTNGKEPLSLPRPFLHDRLYEFSFSGLKTATLNYLRKNDYYRSDPSLPPWARPQDVPQEEILSVAAGFQEAAVEVMTEKVDKAAKRESLSAVSLSGGVAANRLLRECLKERSKKSGWSLHLPARRYCTDNAAMIACAGGYALRKKGAEAFQDYLDMDADPSWALETQMEAQN